MATITEMIEGGMSREEVIRALMDGFNMTRSQAAQQVAFELGEPADDVVLSEEEAQ